RDTHRPGLRISLAGIFTRSSIRSDQISQYFYVYSHRLHTAFSSSNPTREDRARNTACCSELVSPRAPIPLHRQPHQPIAEARVVDPAGLPELGVDAGLGEAGHRVELVDEDGAVGVDEEVAAGEAGAAGELEGADRLLAHAGDLVVGEGRRDEQLHAAVAVLGLVVVPVAVGDHFAGQ